MTVRRALAGVLLAVLGGTLMRCTSDRSSTAESGGLVVSVRSDLSIPKDIDHVTVDVTQFGKTLLHIDRDLGAGALKLPAALMVHSPGNSRPVLVHGIASKDGTPRIERSAVTSVPTAYVGEIELPFDYLCDGTADSDGQSTCPDAETCKLGTCNTTTVPKSEVTRAPVSSSGNGVFVDGGAGSLGADGGAGTCFDVVACMQGQPTAQVDPDACTLSVPPAIAPDHLNLAIALSGSGKGICAPDGSACWVVLDTGDAGWSSDGATITLPPGVCRGASAPVIVVSGACRSKDPATPVCGDWSSATMPIDHPPPPVAGACDGSMTRSCGRCGVQSATCADGVLTGWSACTREGECTPLDTQACATTGATETCGAGCQWGACVCPQGQMECSGKCVAEDDVHACGGCGHDCTALAHVAGGPTCTAGKCGFERAACAAGWDDCDGNPDNGCETDLTQAANCGTCGHACSTADKEKCAATGGTDDCVTSCPDAAPSECGTSCANLSSDANNCGACGKTCAGGEHAQPTCADGACGIVCNAGYSLCDGKCVDLTGDAANCGACGAPCASPRTCQAGSCVCPAAQHYCNGACVPNTALSTCGASCSACTAPAGGSATCDGSKCGTACPAGSTECSGTCVDEKTDNAHCGGCNTPCGAGKTCSGGTCQCPTTQHDCGGKCVNNSALGSCGTACTACPVPANATASCDGTKCSFACAATYTACGASCDVASQGCGTCGTGSQTRTCNPDGTWGVYRPCNGGANLQTDGANCGTCGHVCTAGTTCQSGSCACPAGTESCGGACVNTQTNGQNCGTCGHACSTGIACQSGACCDPSPFQVLSSGEVLDPRTGLVWQRSQDTPPASKCVSGALRLPTYAELAALVVSKDIYNKCAFNLYYAMGADTVNALELDTLGTSDTGSCSAGTATESANAIPFTYPDITDGKPPNCGGVHPCCPPNNPGSSFPLPEASGLCVRAE